MASDEALMREIRTLRQEYETVRKEAGVYWWDRRLKRAYRDAAVLLKASGSGTMPTTRAYMAHPDHGKMSEQDWGWAMGLLRYAGLAYRYGEPGEGLKPISTMGQLKAALRILSETVNRLAAENDQTALNPYMARKYRSTKRSNNHA